MGFGAAELPPTPNNGTLW